MFFSFYFCHWYCCCCRTAVQLDKKNAAITLCMKNINSISNTVIQHNITIILGPFYTSMLTIVSITLIWSNSLLRMTQTAVAKISTHTKDLNKKKITHTTNDITLCVHEKHKKFEQEQCLTHSHTLDTTSLTSPPAATSPTHIVQHRLQRQ